MLYGPPLSSDDEDGLLEDNDWEEFKAKMKEKQRIQNQNLDTNDEKQKLQSFFSDISFGKNETVLEALTNGIDVNVSLHDGWTPLLLAACVGNDELTREFLDRGANLLCLKDGSSPLMLACDKKIDESCVDGVFNVIKVLVDKGADATFRDLKRRTPLMLAAFNNNLKAVEFLLPISDKDAQDNQRWTALFWAVEGNAIEVVEFLITCDFDLTHSDIRGNKLIHVAQQNGFEEIIKILSEDESNKAPLMIMNKLEYFEDIFRKDKPQFLQDICKILYGVKSDDLITVFVNNNISLCEFLSCNEKMLEDLGIKFSFQRRKIMGGLFKFHKHPFHPKSLTALNQKDLSNFDVASVILTCLKQIVTMEGGLQFLMNNYKEKLPVEEAKEFRIVTIKLRQQISKLKLVINVLIEQHKKWDRSLKPADLITKKRSNIPWATLAATTILISIAAAIGVHRYTK